MARLDPKKPQRPVKLPPAAATPKKPAAYRRNTVKVSDRALAFARGEITIDDLDEQEIARGQFRNKNGDFSGRPPALLPREFVSEQMRRHQEQIFRELSEMVLQALKTLDSVMKTGGTGLGANAQVKAAELVLQYNIGKVPDKVEIKGEIETWEHRLDGAVVNWAELADTVPGVKARTLTLNQDKDGRHK